MYSAGGTSFACMTLLSVIDLVQCKTRFAALNCNDAYLSIEDVMQCRVIDRSCIAPRTSYVTPGAILSIFNVVSARSLSLLSSPLSCPSFPVSFIYCVSSNLVYTPSGFNCLCGHIYKKT